MAAYVIVDVQIEDPVQYEEYKKLTPGIVAAYGGKFIARGGPAELLEGDWDFGRVVVLEFPSVARAKQWWASPEYEKAKRIRQSSSTARMIVVAGV